jgi:hypothetical protein
LIKLISENGLKFILKLIISLLCFVLSFLHSLSDQSWKILSKLSSSEEGLDSWCDTNKNCQQIDNNNSHDENLKPFSKLVIDQWFSIQLDHVCEAHHLEAHKLNGPLIEKFQSEIPNSLVWMNTSKVD